jgi:hypothetical protein
MLKATTPRFAADMLFVQADERVGGIYLVFAQLKDSVREKIGRHGLYHTIDHRQLPDIGSCRERVRYRDD